MTDLTATRSTFRPRAPRKGLLGYISLYRQRRALAKLDAAQLQDIGLTRAEAQQEANRPVWDAPQHWYR